ncbi:hypothetical protein [Pararhodobacter marinus]|uniref:Uncharacterized protein n=1 Tax=Pararhodobacter marinus TaxID=2184063 RepID=A0A2U2CII3_9RHOB|nr:hypothetical protein [Pararhodobacter marinus]PWE31672.1 hypothetical protein C4N9_01265 [Pararhodobacter marinus]
MSKHPLDHDHGPSKGRLEKFTAAEKAEMPSAATRELQKRERTKGEAKLRAYTRIEKGGVSG